MALWILPCWTYFSALLRTFCLLNPNNAIRVRASDPGIDIDEAPLTSRNLLPNTAPKVIMPIGRWTYRTRPIVRLDVMNRMVTKGYQKGVYERVTKGTRRQSI